MYRTLFSSFFDSLFVAVATFAVSFVVFSFFMRAGGTLVASLAAAAAAFALLFTFLRKTRGSESLTRKKEDFKKAVLSELCFLSEEEVLKELANAFTVLGETPKTENGSLLLSGKKQIFPVFSFSSPTEDDVAKRYVKRKEGYSALLLGREFSENVTEFAERLSGITLVSGSAVFRLFEKANYYPKINVRLRESRKRAVTLNGFFLKEKWKNFFLTGMLLLFLSFFTVFKIYYVVFGTVLTVFSVFCKFYGKEKRQNC